MRDPSTLSDKTLPELKQIVSDFPCFHAARMLYLKNLAVLNDLRLEVELKKMAIHVPDRMKLFLLLENGRGASRPAREKKNDRFSLIEDFLQERGNGSGPDELQYESPLSTDYTPRLLADEKAPGDSPGGDSPGGGAPYQELINSLTAKEEDKGTAPAESENGDGGAKNSSAETDRASSADDSYFTETLAQIYIRQKRYEKALEIILKLSLKYPKKNIYFADQIRFLEKLIIHTKTK
jgi:hypothetical protein